jgi:5'-deoxynucleotidase YfbR-like HD superfamily hydrolase
VTLPDELRPLQPIVHFLFEVGMLRRTPRSGLQFLGSGDDSVAEHLLRAAYVALAVGSLVPGVDRSKLVLMCLVHDLAEARTGDLNYENKKYVTADEERALQDLASTLPFGGDLEALVSEFNARTTLEARLANDCDQLELLLVLKEELDRGNPQAREWIPFAVKRLREPISRQLAEAVLGTHSSDWWFEDRGDWWVWAGKQAPPEPRPDAES